ncbi:MAG: UDP-N-acetylmuramoyl-tripeptide--D-alanyl-D-alanine ligase [Chlamydiae bacterium]|nr:UDP-N-acetylmuramoyl-tripeptide--D-alanyl-D-alanine ligase [Chlamydiota bacterium]
MLKKFISNPLISNYQVDSRKVSTGTLFFALKGAKTDGHNFLEEVAKKGAFGAVVDEHYQGPFFGLQIFKTNDVLAFLQMLAKEKVKPVKQTICITGSFGKTTTKEFTFSLLEGTFKVGKTSDNYNSQIGFPLSILNMDTNQDLLVLEMGMWYKNEIKKLVDIVAPDVGVITKIGFAHIQNFESVEDIFFAKAEIFFSQKTKLAILNYDLLDMAKNVITQEKIFFSTKDSRADFFLRLKDDKILIFENQKLILETFAVFKESHILENLLGAFTIAKTMGVKVDVIESKIAKLTAAKMRFEKFEKNGIFFINDTYNAQFDSVIAALENLPEVKGKKIAVLGAMNGLGKYEEECHKKVMELALKKVDCLLCLGKEWKKIFSEKIRVEFFLDQLSLSVRLKELMQKNDLVLIKGNRTLEMEKIFHLID